MNEILNGRWVNLRYVFLLLTIPNWLIILWKLSNRLLVHPKFSSLVLAIVHAGHRFTKVLPFYILQSYSSLLKRLRPLNINIKDIKLELTKLTKYSPSPVSKVRFSLFLHSKPWVLTPLLTLNNIASLTALYIGHMIYKDKLTEIQHTLLVSWMPGIKSSLNFRVLSCASTLNSGCFASIDN